MFAAAYSQESRLWGCTPEARIAKIRGQRPRAGGVVGDLATSPGLIPAKGHGDIGVNFYKAARLKPPPHFLGSKAFRPLSPPLFPGAFSQNEG